MTTTRARACEGKQAHQTRQQAKDHRRGLIRAGASPARVAVYKCKRGPHWHVGHVGRRGHGSTV